MKFSYLIVVMILVVISSLEIDGKRRKHHHNHHKSSHGQVSKVSFVSEGKIRGRSMTQGPAATSDEKSVLTWDICRKQCCNELCKKAHVRCNRICEIIGPQSFN